MTMQAGDQDEEIEQMSENKDAKAAAPAAHHQTHSITRRKEEGSVLA